MTNDERLTFSYIVGVCKANCGHVEITGDEARALIAAHSDLSRYKKALEQIASRNHPSLNRGLAIKALEET